MCKEELIALGYSSTQDTTKMDVDTVHWFISTKSTWALGIPRETVIKSMANSMCFAVLYRDGLVAFCRAITDKATFANLVDMFVLPEHRGKGLSRWLINEALSHPGLQGLRRFTLATSTAKGLYAKFGFAPLTKPDTFMEIFRPTIYAAPGTGNAAAPSSPNRPV